MKKTAFVKKTSEREKKKGGRKLYKKNIESDDKKNKNKQDR